MNFKNVFKQFFKKIKVLSYQNKINFLKTYYDDMNKLYN